MLTYSGNCSSQNQQRGDSRNLGALWMALAITFVFMLGEAVGGYWTNSLVLLADAGHMLTDVAALGLGLFAAWISSRPATPRKTYGYYRVEILAAMINGCGLLAISMLILYESWVRLQQPREVSAGPMLAIAFAGLIANLACARILYRTHSHSLNVRGAMLHVMGDALGSVAAMIAGICMLLWNWYVADPITSVVVSMLIFYGACRLVKDSVDILLEGTPAGIDVPALENGLARVDGVASIHDLHVWSITSGMISMSCHAVVNGRRDRQEMLAGMNAVLRDRFRIYHSTIQLEEESQQGGHEDFCRAANCGFAGAR
jgi:cobalt-zinc-cadmium efflux system protein